MTMSSASAASTTRQTLPLPTGTQQIGRMSTDCEDPSRCDPYADDPATRRKLVLWIWYPAEPRSCGQEAEFLPPSWTPIADQLGVDVTGLHTHATVDAPAADQRNPVLVLSPSGFSPLFLASIAEELASHGYVVVGVNHTFETAVTVFADGRVAAMNPAALGGALGPQTGPYEEAFRRRAAVCNYKAADLRFVAEHLEGLAPNAACLTADHLDLTRLGAFGHSFGGNAALEWCRADEHCRAAANLDGAIWTEVGSVGLPRPALQLLADHPEFALSGADAVTTGIAADPVWHDAERMLARDGWRTLDRRAHPGHTARIAGSTHMSFMDIPFLRVHRDSPVAGMLAATSIEPERMWRITSDLLLGFFNRYLDFVSTPDVAFAGPATPEVSIGPP